MRPRFVDRRDAGRQLAEALAELRGEPGLIVLGLPRGGVPVAAEVARGLDAELDVLVVRKLGLPWHPELAMGAIASAGAEVRNEEVIALTGVDAEDFARVLARERAELARRERSFRGERPPLEVRGRTVIVVDDGVATGATLLAGLSALRRQNPARLVAAVPVAPPDALARLRSVADEVVCLASPPDFGAVGEAYRRFEQTDDEEVRACLTPPDDRPGNR